MRQVDGRARRPRDRRRQILITAAEQFRTSGYHNVGLADIADELGVTVPALYRHFNSKQELLLATVRDAIEYFTPLWAQKHASLDDLLRTMCAISVERRDTGVLWEREVAHLPKDLRQGLRAQFLNSVTPVRSAIARARPDLDSDAVDVLVWAVIGVCVSVGYHPVRVDPGLLEARLVEAAQAVCATTPVPSAKAMEPVCAPGQSSEIQPASRREAILAAATLLIPMHGYPAVGVDEIGEAAGITGATVYHHFPNKAAILSAMLRRWLEAMFFDLSGCLNTASTRDEALDFVLQSYMRSGVQQGKVLGALLNEIVNLPSDERMRLHQSMIDYVGEWAALLVAHRPDLSEPEARIFVHAIMSVANSLLRIPHLRRRPTLYGDLVALGRAILGLNKPAGG